MLKLAEAALAVQGHLQGGAERVFSRVTTDSRHIQAGDLFVALKGEHFDGHAFAEHAIAQGAAAVMVASSAHCVASPAIVVEDTRLALGQLAAYWRSLHAQTPIVAVTGSNGKTSVKEMLHSILSEAVGSECVWATQGNFNNDIGMPLTLLALKAQHRYAVLEMGMNHAGEIAYLTQLAKPNAALVNNAGAAHLEFLGTVEGVAKAKGEIFLGLDPTGVAIWNQKDAYAGVWRALAQPYRQLCFGDENADVWASGLVLNPLTSFFILHTPQGEAKIQLKVAGQHNVMNALAAAAAAHAVQVPLAAIAAGLNHFAGVKGRLQVKQGLNGAVLVDDTYNANPTSVKAAIEVLSQQQGVRCLVLGDLGELALDAQADLLSLGQAAKQAGIDYLYTCGSVSESVSRGYGEGARHFADKAALLTSLLSKVRADWTVLVKGSRFMRMEEIVAGLEE